MTDFALRRRRLMDRLAQDAFLVVNYEHSDPATLQYLTGFTGEGALIVGRTRGDDLLLTDSRYVEQAERQAPEIPVQETRGWFGKAAAASLDDRAVTPVAFASPRVSHAWSESMRRFASVQLIGIHDPVAELRAIKDEDEADQLRRAASIADDALQALLPEIRPGMDEVEVALRLEWLMREAGSEGVGFEINVSSGENAALNHYTPTLGRRTLKPGDLLLFDFGACVGGYRSDVTRTISVGPATAQGRAIYAVVLDANRAAIEATRAGCTGVEIDAIAREVIAQAGYGDRFGHGLGHGIGLEVHEKPSLSPMSQDTLCAGMVVTIEPGIYIPGFGGVRIEDDVIVTETGCEVITAFPKNTLIEVGS